MVCGNGIKWYVVMVSNGSGDPRSKFFVGSKFFETHEEGERYKNYKKAKLTKLLLIFNCFINFNDAILELI
jgi:hypothetical protein